MAFSQGTSLIASTTKVVGAVVSTGGVGGILGTATTEGVQQTNLAQQIAPPTRLGKSEWFGVPARVLKGQLLLAAIGGVILAMVLHVSVDQRRGEMPPWFMGFVISVLIAFLVLKVHMWRRVILYNKHVLPRLFKGWKNSWLCNKCGHVFR
jgi:hypothetical protein